MPKKPTLNRLFVYGPLRSLFQFCVRKHVFALLVPFFVFVIRRYSLKRFGRQQKRSQNFTVLFAINSEYFRGDLEILANGETFSIMPVYWQWQLINTFYPQSVQRDLLSVQKWAKAQNH